MLVLRCTRKLLARLRVDPAPVDAESTTVLGEWYATILSIRPVHLVLLVNERSRLPVVLPARQLSTLFGRIPEAVADVLTDLGVEAGVVAREQIAMSDISCSTTSNRSVLGAMNEFVFQIQWMREDGDGDLPDLRALNRELGGHLIGVGGKDYLHPADEARRLLPQGGLKFREACEPVDDRLVHPPE